jgi:hypothetical protein
LNPSMFLNNLPKILGLLPSILRERVHLVRRRNWNSNENPQRRNTTQQLKGTLCELAGEGETKREKERERERMKLGASSTYSWEITCKTHTMSADVAALLLAKCFRVLKSYAWCYKLLLIYISDIKMLV